MDRHTKSTRIVDVLLWGLVGLFAGMGACGGDTSGVLAGAAFGLLLASPLFWWSGRRKKRYRAQWEKGVIVEATVQSAAEGTVPGVHGETVPTWVVQVIWTRSDGQARVGFFNHPRIEHVPPPASGEVWPLLESASDKDVAMVLRTPMSYQAVTGVAAPS